MSFSDVNDGTTYILAHLDLFSSSLSPSLSLSLLHSLSFFSASVLFTSELESHLALLSRESACKMSATTADHSPWRGGRLPDWISQSSLASVRVIRGRRRLAFADELLTAALKSLSGSGVCRTRARCMVSSASSRTTVGGEENRSPGQSHSQKRHHPHIASLVPSCCIPAPGSLLL